MNELTLGEVSNKVLKKDDQVNNANKYENDLVYNPGIILINIVCFILVKHNQLTLNLIH